MGKKYDLLKERLQSHKVRDLLIVNDRLIREKQFAEAQGLLTKMDQLEKKVRDFHSQDQKLFDQWYELTFRLDREAVESAESQYRDLARFHNWVVATSRRLRMGMAEAYALMRQEETRFRQGSDRERESIEKARRERDEFIEEDARERYNEDLDFDDEDDFEAPNEESTHFDQLLLHMEDLLLKEDRELGLSVSQRMQRLAEVADEELRDWLQDSEVAFVLFDLSLSWADSQGNPLLFLKIWKLMPQSQRRFFSQVYHSITGQSLEAQVNRWSSQSRRTEFDEDGENEEEEFHFNEEFIGARGRSSFATSLSPSQDEKLKGLYRKLIRKLHPDLNASQPAGTHWMQRIWGSVQKAYNSQDVKGLERLWSLTLLRLEDLSQLSLDEIHQAQIWLQKDLAEMEKETKQLRKSMAWGFSTRKNYSPLVRKIRAEFEESLRSVQARIDELEEEHQILQRLSEMEREPSRKRGPKARKKGSRRWDLPR